MRVQKVMRTPSLHVQRLGLEWLTGRHLVFSRALCRVAAECLDLAEGGSFYDMRTRQKRKRKEGVLELRLWIAEFNNIVLQSIPFVGSGVLRCLCGDASSRLFKE